MSERVSLWPKVFLAVEQLRTKFLPDAQPPDLVAQNPWEVSSVVTTGINAPFLFHLAPHFFLGLGPTISTDLHNSTGYNSSTGTYGAPNRQTILGASSAVGGWL